MRFYFHLHDDVDSIDEEGRELSGRAPAHAAAMARPAKWLQKAS